MRRSKVPLGELNTHLRGYSARLERDYSNGSRHVYFSGPLDMWIVVRKKGKNAEMEFTKECPCSSEN